MGEMHTCMQAQMGEMQAQMGEMHTCMQAPSPHRTSMRRSIYRYALGRLQPFQRQARRAISRPPSRQVRRRPRGSRPRPRGSNRRRRSRRRRAACRAACRSVRGTEAKESRRCARGSGATDCLIWTARGSGALPAAPSARRGPGGSSNLPRGSSNLPRNETPVTVPPLPNMGTPVMTPPRRPRCPKTLHLRRVVCSECLGQKSKFAQGERGSRYNLRPLQPS